LWPDADQADLLRAPVEADVEDVASPDAGDPSVQICSCRRGGTGRERDREECGRSHESSRSCHFA
jgi:hypothetical protein